MSASNESLTVAWIIKKFRERKRVPVFTETLYRVGAHGFEPRTLCL
jgi:hypothetical protein